MRKKNIKNVSFAKRNICALKDSDEKYDGVIAGNVIHLTDEPAAAFSELMRVTKKGGKIIIPTYLTDEKLTSRLYIKLYSLLGYRAANSFSYKSYTEFIKKLCRENGASDFSVHMINGLMPAGFAIITK